MSIKQISYLFIRLTVVMALSFMLAKPINKENYDNYYNKALFKVHTTDLNFLSDQLRTKLSYYFIMNNISELQNILDSNFGVFGFVITDCTAENRDCPEQKMLYTSNVNLNWRKFPTLQDLTKEPFILLRGPMPLSVSPQRNRKTRLFEVDHSTQRDIIGRLYILSNMPKSFDEDYRLWMRTPLRDMGVWKYYLKTVGFCLTGGFLIWIIIELMLGLRRVQINNIKQREYELIKDAEDYLKLLEEKNIQLEEQDKYTTKQFEIYLNKTKELELKVRNIDEYKRYTETVINELEEAKREQSERLQKELAKTRHDMNILLDKVAEFESASERDKKETYMALENAVKTKFSNTFEQLVTENIQKNRKVVKGEWRVLNSFNVAAGRNYSQFTDCIVISKECLCVIEAKNYPGTIDSEGDFENNSWFCSTGTEKKEIKSLWGENPYHQANEYCMSLMRMIKNRGLVNMAVYGIIVFPEGTDISKIGTHLGKFYRVTTIDRLSGVLENIEAEARRNNAFSKRPTPLQIENMLRGRGSASSLHNVL